MSDEEKTPPKTTAEELAAVQAALEELAIRIVEDLGRGFRVCSEIFDEWATLAKEQKGMRDLQAYHYVWDGLDIPEIPRALVIREYLRLTVSDLGMTPIGEPVVMVTGPSWSGIQLIGESHISIHGFRDRGWADVFSCRPFDPKQAQARLEEYFHGNWLQHKVRR